MSSCEIGEIGTLSLLFRKYLIQIDANGKNPRILNQFLRYEVSFVLCNNRVI